MTQWPRHGVARARTRMPGRERALARAPRHRATQALARPATAPRAPRRTPLAFSTPSTPVTTEFIRVRRRVAIDVHVTVSALLHSSSESEPPGTAAAAAEPPGFEAAPPAKGAGGGSGASLASGEGAAACGLRRADATVPMPTSPCVATGPRALVTATVAK